MLRSFGDKDTERVWQRRRSRRLDQPTQRAALRNLLILDAADQLRDLRAPPGNRLEKLKGDRADTYSNRINDQWRICFRWTAPDPKTSRSSTTTDGLTVRGEDMTRPDIDPIHPGEVLMSEYLEPLGVTQHRVAIAIGAPPRRINEVVHGKRGITAVTALRLARYFDTSERFWLNLQCRYEIETERDRLAGTLDRIEPLATA